MSRPLSILIVGGGVAGLATSVALRQRTKHNVTLLERGDLPGVPHSLLIDDAQADIVRGSGEEENVAGSKADEYQDYGIAVVNNGIRMLQMLGLKDPIKELTGQNFDIYNVRAHDNAGTPTTPFPQDPTSPAVFCRRSALIKWLVTAAASPDLPGTPVKIHVNASTTGLDIQAAKAGNYSADLLILSDGIGKSGRNAVLAAQGLPAEDADDSTVLLGYMGVLPTSALAVPELSHLVNKDGSPCGSLTNWTWDPPAPKGMPEPRTPEEAFFFEMEKAKRQQRIVIYPLDKANCQLFAYKPAEPKLLERFPRGSYGTRAGFIRGIEASEAQDVFEPFAPEIKKLLAACPKLDLAQIRDAPRTDKWSAGRAVLIGDAAHAILPHVGQGSSQALEDAEALSHFLAPLGATDAADGGPADIPELAAALAAFEAIRVPRAQLVQRAARALLGALPPQELPLAAAFTQELVLEYAGAEAELAKA